MNIEANAKINLALDVVRRRADGYHELRMIMLPLQLHDTLTIVRSAQDKLESDCPQMPCDESNLILKALAFMRARCGISDIFISWCKSASRCRPGWLAAAPMPAR